MSDELNKEMEDVVEATAKPTGGKSCKAPSGTKTTVKPKQEPENMQKAPTTGSSNTFKQKAMQSWLLLRRIHPKPKWRKPKWKTK